MQSARFAIIPGIVLPSIVIYFLAGLVFSPEGAAHATEDHQAEFSSAASSIELDNPGCSLSQKFPQSIRQWCNLIESSAAEYELSTSLIASVMLQESGGDPQIISASGAVGLMQIMPRDGTAAGFVCANGPCFQNRPTMAELFDPQFNIEYGARVLADLIGYYGNTRDGLKAYGPYKCRL